MNRRGASTTDLPELSAQLHVQLRFCVQIHMQGTLFLCTNRRRHTYLQSPIRLYVHEAHMLCWFVHFTCTSDVQMYMSHQRTPLHLLLAYADNQFPWSAHTCFTRHVACHIVGW